MITLSPKWAKELASKPETGMGYQVVSVVLTALSMAPPTREFVVPNGPIPADATIRVVGQ
jgi:hypothetical protein